MGEISMSDTMNHLLTRLAPPYRLSIRSTVLAHRKKTTRKPKHQNPCTVVMGLIKKSDSDWCTVLGFLCSHQKLSCRLPNNRVTIECFLRPSVKIQKSWNMDSLPAPYSSCCGWQCKYNKHAADFRCRHVLIFSFIPVASFMWLGRWGVSVSVLKVLQVLEIPVFTLYIWGQRGIWKP